MKRSNGKSYLALLLAGSLLLSGCSITKEDKITEKEDPISIEFDWWGNDSRHNYTMEAIKIFNNQNPNIAVNYRYGEWAGYEKRNKVRMMSNTSADVMQINYAWLDTYSSDGEGYYDINELTDYIDLSGYSEEDLQFGMQNGKLNALPIAFNTPTIYYNQDLYDKYGLSLPATWEDLFDAAKVMSKDNIYPIGMLKKQLFLFLIAYYEQTTGKAFFDENGKLQLTAKDMEYVLEFYKRLIDEKVMLTVDQWKRNDLTSGSTAGALFWVSDSDNYCGSIEGGGFKPVLGEYPGVKEHTGGKSGWYMKPATMYAISKNSENPKEAAILLDYLVNSPEMAMQQNTEKGIPVSDKAFSTLEKEGLLTGYCAAANDKMMSERDSMAIMLPVMENETVINAFKNGADNYLYDKADLHETAESIVSEMNEIIDMLE